jgi:replicative DNA helicase
VAIFSYESDIIETGQRIFSTRYRIPLRTKINQDAYFKMMQGSQYYYRSGLWVDDTFPTLSQAINRMKRLKISEGLDLVVLDYIGLIPCDVAKSGSNREQEISTITRTLKRTAMQLDIPIIACSQLRRKEKENSEPELSDLRESGAIEQDADVVMFIHWETDQNQQIHHKLLIKKGRNIALGDIELIFSGEYTRFDCLHSDDDMPPF